MFAALAAYCFWRWVNVVQLPLTLPQMTSALSIFIAAVLVRLARGMPTLDWKNVPIDKRENLTGELVKVSREYAGLLVLLMLLLILTVSIGSLTNWVVHLNEKWGRLISAAVGFLVALSLLRFGYVVWRDLDIVALQKAVIDGMAKQEQTDQNSKLANAKLAEMKQAKLSGGANPEVEAFDEGTDR